MLAWSKIFSQWTQLCEIWNAYWNVCLFTPRLWFEIRPKLTVPGSWGCSIWSHRSAWNTLRCVVLSWRYTTQPRAQSGSVILRYWATCWWERKNPFEACRHTKDEVPGQRWCEGAFALAALGVTGCSKVLWFSPFFLLCHLSPEVKMWAYCRKIRILAEPGSFSCTKDVWMWGFLLRSKTHNWMTSSLMKCFSVFGRNRNQRWRTMQEAGWSESTDLWRWG